MKKLGGEPLVIGRGSNLLAKEGELPVVVVNPAIVTEPVCVEDRGEEVLVHVGQGIGFLSS